MMPTVLLPRGFTLNFDDGRKVEFPGPGRYNVDAEIAGHSFMKRLVVEDKPLSAGATAQVPLSPQRWQEPLGHLPTPATKPEAPFEPGTQDSSGQIAIADDWQDQHHMQRIALAKRLAPDQTVDTATQADAIIQAESERRAQRPGAAAAGRPPLTDQERNRLTELRTPGRPMPPADLAERDALAARENLR
jgi:hypothetical protein